MNNEMRATLLDGMKSRVDRSGLIYPDIARRQQLINTRVVDHMAALPGENVLDLCSGSMGVYEQASLIPLNYYGVDIAIHSLEAHPSQNVIQTDVATLPFRNSSFDHSVCVMALHNALATEQTIHEVSRVLRSGGTLTIAENGISNWITNLIIQGNNMSGLLNISEIETAQKFFFQYNIDPLTYSNVSSDRLFGRSLEELFDGITFNDTGSKRDKKSSRYKVVRRMNSAFHENVEKIALNSGLKPTKKFVIPAYHDAEWVVEEGVEVDSDIPTSEIYSAVISGNVKAISNPSVLRKPSIMYLFLTTFEKN